MLRGDEMDEMFCENDFCIYCEKGKCTLTKISLDGNGVCIEGINISIEKDLLKSLKDKTLSNLNKR